MDGITGHGRKRMEDARFPHMRGSDAGAQASSPRGGEPPPAPATLYPANSAVSSSPASESRPIAHEVLIANFRAPFPEKIGVIAERFGWTPGYLRSLTYQLRKAGAIPKGAGRGLTEKAKADTRKRNKKFFESNLEIAQERLGVAAAERLQPAPEPVVQPAAREKKADSLSWEEIMELVKDGQILTSDERQKILSVLAVRGSQQTMVAAARALEDIDRQTGRQVGPPPPSSDEEMVYRGTRMLEALGRKNGEAAYREAEKLWAEAEAVDRGVRWDAAGGGGDAGREGPEGAGSGAEPGAVLGGSEDGGDEDVPDGGAGADGGDAEGA